MSEERKSKRYSIAEARDQLARIVHEVEKGTLIELTRRRDPVAVMISLQDYQRLRRQKGEFWKKVEEFRKRTNPDDLLKPGEFEGLRDSSLGRAVDIS